MPQDRLVVPIVAVVETSMETIIAGMFKSAATNGERGVGVPSQYEAVYVQTGPVVVEGVRYPSSMLVAFMDEGEPVEQPDPSNN